jgi:anti-sigma regulatory factor (Ser/Thr protein kinase)
MGIPPEEAWDWDLEEPNGFPMNLKSSQHLERAHVSSSLDGSRKYLGQSTRLWINDPSGVSEARRLGALFAQQMGLNEELTGRVSLVITEAGNNIAFHAGSGALVLRKVTCRGSRGVEILALDKGPGIADVGLCLEDGYSTRGTQGTGLGAMKRMSTHFDIHSQPGMGTAVMCNVMDKTPEGSTGGLGDGSVSIAVGEETQCGDAWGISHGSDKTLVVVVDGLGHGPYAAEASQEALGVFEDHKEEEPSWIIQLMHGALNKTRGASVAVGLIDLRKQEVRLAGVGNIAGQIIRDGKSRSMVSVNGTLGHQLNRVQQYSYPWAEDALLVMASDGLATQWLLPAYGALAQRHPSLVAGVLVRDYARVRDDVTVVVVGKA